MAASGGRTILDCRVCRAERPAVVEGRCGAQASERDAMGVDSGDDLDEVLQRGAQGGRGRVLGGKWAHA